MRFPYQDPSLPVEERVEDLISRMTTREKVSQLNCMMGMGLSDLEKAGLDNGLGEMDLMSLPADQMAAVVTAVQQRDGSICWYLQRGVMGVVGV